MPSSTPSTLPLHLRSHMIEKFIRLPTILREVRRTGSGRQAEGERGISVVWCEEGGPGQRHKGDDVVMQWLRGPHACPLLERKNMVQHPATGRQVQTSPPGLATTNRTPCAATHSAASKRDAATGRAIHRAAPPAHLQPTAQCPSLPQPRRPRSLLTHRVPAKAGRERSGQSVTATQTAPEDGVRAGAPQVRHCPLVRLSVRPSAYHELAAWHTCSPASALALYCYFIAIANEA